MLPDLNGANETAAGDTEQEKVDAETDGAEVRGFV